MRKLKVTEKYVARISDLLKVIVSVKTVENGKLESVRLHSFNAEVPPDTIRDTLKAMYAADEIEYQPLLLCDLDSDNLPF